MLDGGGRARRRPSSRPPRAALAAAPVAQCAVSIKAVLRTPVPPAVAARGGRPFASGPVDTDRHGQPVLPFCVAFHLRRRATSRAHEGAAAGASRAGLEGVSAGWRATHRCESEATGVNSGRIECLQRSRHVSFIQTAELVLSFPFRRRQLSPSCKVRERAHKRAERGTKGKGKQRAAQLISSPPARAEAAAKQSEVLFPHKKLRWLMPMFVLAEFSGNIWCEKFGVSRRLLSSASTKQHLIPDRS